MEGLAGFLPLFIFLFRSELAAMFHCFGTCDKHYQVPHY